MSAQKCILDYRGGPLDPRWILSVLGSKSGYPFGGLGIDVFNNCIMGYDLILRYALCRRTLHMGVTLEAAVFEPIEVTKRSFCRMR